MLQKRFIGLESPASPSVAACVFKLLWWVLRFRFSKDIRERVDYSLFLDKQAAKTTIISNITQFIFLLIPFICCSVVNCTVAAFASNSRYGKIIYTPVFSQHCVFIIRSHSQMTSQHWTTNSNLKSWWKLTRRDQRSSETIINDEKSKAGLSGRFWFRAVHKWHRVFEAPRGMSKADDRLT